ncbi:ABC-2 type transporter (Fragment [Limnochorda pilosa]|uniref:Transport permease protein n=1 Tax=Limnochorda pilosa TaxID=1555112 RepID=A0A0K2SJ82_LIMPI|nr:ABC-2 type transporter (Fragment [Limnochorda pilosa]
MRLLRTVRAVLVREWYVNLRAYRVSFFLSTGMASLFTLLIGYFLYHTVFAGRITEEFAALAGTDRYMSYLTVGVLVYLFATRLLYPVRTFLVEHWEGTLPVMTMMGVPRLAYHLGCVLFSALYSAVEVSVVLVVVALSIGLELPAVPLPAVAAALAASFVGLYGLSLVLAAVILSVRDRVVVEAAAFSLMQLLCGVLFPVGYLPRAAQVVAEVIPLTPSLRALRAATLAGVGVGGILPDLVSLLVLGIVYTGLGGVLLGRVVGRVMEQTA